MHCTKNICASWKKKLDTVAGNGTIKHTVEVRPEDLKETDVRIPVQLMKESDGFHIVSGHMRLQAALSLADEVIVDAPGFGEVLVVKCPDGSFVATQDQQSIALLGL